jgi:putative heme-binding domain-containing protein
MTMARASRVIPALLLVLGASTAAQAAGLPKVPDDLEVRLVATTPSFLYACQVACAPDGALYVAVDPMDQVGPYESNLGKIYVYRDGQDPVLFAEGFRAIFGMAWHDGALYVSHMPFLSVIRDTDGDGKADSRKDLFKDLGITNNHGLNDHIVSGIQFGIDNHLYISTGDKGVLKATGPDGKTAQVVGGGTLRCKPDGTEIEVISTGTRNHLEPNLDARDNLFTYDNTDDGDGWWTRVTHHIDGGYYGYPYDYHNHKDRFLNRIAEFGGGSPCGGVVYKEDAWPEKYRGRAIWSEWGKKKLSAFAFEPDGASFKIKDVIELAEPGDSGEFRPLDCALSYDGKTLYIADWGMGSWGSKTEQVGRVWAITYKGPPIPTRPRGKDTDSIEDQIKQLDHPSWNERMRAQNCLIARWRESSDQVQVALSRAVEKRTDPIAQRHLVWAIDGIIGEMITHKNTSVDELIGELLITLMLSHDPDVKTQVVRMIGERRIKEAQEVLIPDLALKALKPPGWLGRLIQRRLLSKPRPFGPLQDPDPTVRLQTIITLGRLGQPESVPFLLPFLTDPDRYIAFATRVALRRIGDWTAVAAGLNTTDLKLRAEILSTLELVYDQGATSLLSQVISDNKASESERAKALTELALVHKKAPGWDGHWWGTRPTQGKPPSKSIAWEATTAILKTIESSLTDPSDDVRLAAISAVRETDDRDALPILRERFTIEKVPQVRQEIALTLGSMGDKTSLPLLISALRDLSNPEGVRNAALTGLETIGGKPAIEALVEALSNQKMTLKDETLVRMVAALGRFKAKEAIPAISARLSTGSNDVRVASSEALGKIGDLKLGAPPLRLALKDKAPEVRKASVTALASLADRESIPAMIETANDEATRYEGTLALAKLPDVRALQVYLRGVTDRSPDVRKASASAIGSIRDKAEPVLTQLADRRELPPGALPELRKIYNLLQPVEAWHVMGPFPFNDRPPVRGNAKIDLNATAPGPDGTTLAWKPIPNDRETGAVDLAKFYGGKGDCSAFGTAELESPTARPAQMAVGSDDTLTVWLNGKQVYKFGGNRGYDPEVARFDVELRKGKNVLLIQCGNGGGPWIYSVAVTGLADFAFLKGPSTGGFDPDKFKAAALKGQGNPDHGKALFFDTKGLACAKCHVVGGQGGAIGPELSGIAAKYPKEELIASILYPSARIFSGYETVVVATSDGKVLTGLVKSDNADGLEIQDAEGKRIKIPKADIEERKTSDLSLMPNGIVEGITPQDFADLVAYLETLKDAAANQSKPKGQ